MSGFPYKTRLRLDCGGSITHFQPGFLSHTCKQETSNLYECNSVDPFCAFDGAPRPREKRTKKEHEARTLKIITKTASIMFTENSYFPAHTRTSIIYISCIAFFFIALAALPYLKTDVSVRSPALIRPASEVNTIRSIASGRVKETHIAENKRVKEGDLLFVLESETLNEQENFYKNKIALTETFIADAELLLATSKPAIPNAPSSTKASAYTSFRTDKSEGRQSLMPNAQVLSPNPQVPSPTNAIYRQSYFTYQQKLIEAQTVLNKAKQAHDRQYKLYQEKVIAAMEFENYQFELKKAEDAIAQLKETQRSQWQSELKNLQEEKRELESQLVRVQKEKAMLTITAPVTGTVQSLTGVYPGSMVYANQELGQISPDTNLLVIAYVQPNDIGFIKKDMDVRLQVDAFNYNQWGHASGKVTAVPQDIKIIDNKPVFEVRCSLDKDYLQLKSGYRGFLKKGMTLQVRFIVTRRSLWQLLYDKVDDWVNPNLK
jgi:membrane fusion protein, peptide pheromone/bacteriocin exporter